MDEARAHAFTEALQQMRIVSNWDLAAATILVFDTFLTFDQEVKLVWSSRWSLTKVLYLITRYTPFVDGVFVLWHHHTSDMSVSNCKIAFKCSGWMFVICMNLGLVILLMRTLAVWNRDRVLSIVLPALLFLQTVGALINIGVYLESLEFSPMPYPGLKGCLIVAADPTLVVSWVLFIAIESVIIGLLFVKAFRQFRLSDRETPALLALVIRDGIMYYVYMLILSVANIVAIVTLPHGMAHLLTYLERDVYALLICRVVLHIRAQAKKQQVIGVSIPNEHDRINMATLRFYNGRPQTTVCNDNGV